MSLAFRVNGLVTMAESLLSDFETSNSSGQVQAAPCFRGSGQAADGRVIVTIGDGGYLTDLEIDETWLRSVGARGVAEAIKQAVARAVDQIHAQVAEATKSPTELAELSQVMHDAFQQLATDVARASSRW